VVVGRGAALVVVVYAGAQRGKSAAPAASRKKLQLELARKLERAARGSRAQGGQCSRSLPPALTKIAAHNGWRAKVAEGEGQGQRKTARMCERAGGKEAEAVKRKRKQRRRQQPTRARATRPHGHTRSMCYLPGNSPLLLLPSSNVPSISPIIHTNYPLCPTLLVRHHQLKIYSLYSCN
jgi:hypothetical protein